MRIGLSTAPLAFRLRGAGGSAVDNPTEQGFHLRNPKTCPNKPGHLCRCQFLDVRWKGKPRETAIVSSLSKGYVFRREGHVFSLFT